MSVGSFLHPAILSWLSPRRIAAGATLLGCAATGFGCTGARSSQGQEEALRTFRDPRSSRYVVRGDFFKEGFDRSVRSTSIHEPTVALPRPKNAVNAKNAEDTLRSVREATSGTSLEAALRAGAKERSLGFIVESIGLEPLLAMGKARGIRVNDILAMSDTVSVRGLTHYETDRVRKVYRGSVDASNVRLHFTTDLSAFRTHSLVIGNTVFVDSAWQELDLLPGTTLPRDREKNDAYNAVLLGHQMKHVRSYQVMGAPYAMQTFTEQLTATRNKSNLRGRVLGYDLADLRDRRIRSVFDLGEEQRAELMEDYVRAQRETGRFVRLKGVRGNRTVDRRSYLRSVEPFVTELLHTPDVRRPPDRFGDWVNKNAEQILSDAKRFLESRPQSSDPNESVLLASFLQGAASLSFV